MSSFDSFDCTECGASFTALPGSNAAERGYCSPTCASAGEGYA